MNQDEIKFFVESAKRLKKENYLEYIKIKSFLEGMERQRRQDEKRCLKSC